MDWIITLAYLIVPLWKAYTMYRLRGWHWDSVGIVLHLLLVGVRRAIRQAWADDPTLWAQIHALTMMLALAGVCIEAWRWRRRGRLFDGGI